jgi:signal transduction histidine kinase
MFGSIIRNLVSNAVKFTPKGGQITIIAELLSDNWVKFTVKDTGIGMNREMIDNLFQLNMQTNRRGTEGEYSSGLGLSLCKDFIRHHGGKIWAESKVGKGSAFRFTLPAR